MPKRPRAARSKGTGRSDRSAGEFPAKLTRPKLADAIARPRLFRILDRLLRKPVAWIHAPAGAGKTTLLASYLSARKARVLWYDTDAGDADVSSLYHYARRAGEALTGNRLALPVPRPGSPDGQRAFARRFFEALFAQLPAGTVVVFDNYQDAVSAPAWNETFRDLCSTITTRVRVMVASRVAPPPGLARFAAEGKLVLLDWTSLRLDRAEVGRFLAREGRTAAGESGRLLALTDGWAVAVALLAKAHSTRSGAEPKVRNTAGSIESVFPFLASEILDRLDVPTRDLLMAIALFPSFSIKMAATLTGQSNAGQLLSRLHGDHLLIERQGETDFRLHDLFRMFLLERARVAHGEQGLNALSVRAAMLLADTDQFQSAAELLAGAGAWTVLGDLIERQAPSLTAQGRLATLGTALESIPAEQRDGRPWLVFWLAVTALGQPGGRAQTLAERAFNDFRGAKNPHGTLLAWSLVVQAIVIGADDFHQLEHWLRTLDELALPPPTADIATRVAMSEVFAYAFWEPGTLRALEVADRGVEIVRKHGTAEDRIMVSGAALLLYLNGGRRERAQEMCLLARGEFRAAGDDALARLAYLHSEAVFQFQTDGFEASLRAVEQGLALAQSSGIEVWNGSLLMLGFLSARAKSDLDAAERFLDAMSPLAANGPTFLRAQYMFGRAALAIERGDADAGVRGLRESLTYSDRLGFRFSCCQGAIAEVYCEAVRGDADQVRQALARMEVRLRAADCPYLVAETTLVRAYARLCLGEDPREDLRSALSFQRRSGISPGGFLGPRVMAVTLAAALEHDIEPDLAAKLITAYGLRPGPEAHAVAAWPWRLRIRVLGPLQVEVDGRALRFGRKVPTVPLALLKMLVAAREPLSVARLTSALWPGYGADAPRGTLDTALYRLRKLVGLDDFVASDRSRFALSDQSCWTDVRAFGLACARITELVGADTPSAAAIERCERRLLDLYRGPLGAQDDPPAIARAREDLRRRFAGAVGGLGSLWRRVGENGREDTLVHVARARDEEAPIVGAA